MSDYCVCVTFEVAERDAERFLARVTQQAHDSLTEPGCSRFVVWTDSTRPGSVFLYETYTDRAAFDAHLASPHFLAFDAAVAEMLEDKTVLTYDRRAQHG